MSLLVLVGVLLQDHAQGDARGSRAALRGETRRTNKPDIPAPAHFDRIGALDPSLKILSLHLKLAGALARPPFHL
jgi:hypothetical protein